MDELRRWRQPDRIAHPGGSGIGSRSAPRCAPCGASRCLTDRLTAHVTRQASAFSVSLPPPCRFGPSDQGPVLSPCKCLDNSMVHYLPLSDLFAQSILGSTVQASGFPSHSILSVPRLDNPTDELHRNNTTTLPRPPTYLQAAPGRLTTSAE